MTDRLARRSKEVSLKTSSRLLGTRDSFACDATASAMVSSMNHDPTAWKSSWLCSREETRTASRFDCACMICGANASEYARG